MMHAAVATALKPAPADFPASAVSLSQPSATQRLRQSAADLFRQGRLSEADLLTSEALQQYPDSEDVLVIRALICQVRHDWAGAAIVLERLVRLQGKGAPAETWCQWVRVLRCEGRLQLAMDMATEGLVLHPLQAVLTTELMEIGQALADQGGSAQTEPLRRAA